MLAATQISFAQVARTSWSFGFGLDYPTFFSSNVRPATANFGGFLSLQHNFYENVALRLLAGYNRLEGKMPSGSNYVYSNGAPVPLDATMHSTILGGNLDLLYYFSPCSVVDPYAALGIGIASFKADWGDIVNPNAISKTTMQMNLILGSEWRLSNSWNLKTEIGLHSLDGQVDGIVNNNRKGIFGSDADSYITANLGLQYYFSKGQPSKYCDLYNGIEVQVQPQNYPTLSQIEEMIKKHIPKVVVQKVEVEVPVAKPKPVKKSWVLLGVNFNFGKSTLSPEAYPILSNAVQILKDNPNLKVEIDGYTDNIGSESYNQKLSLARAQTVKNFLIKNGIESNRLKAVGYGEKDPIGDNSTDSGRAQNRRIEFKVIK